MKLTSLCRSLLLVLLFGAACGPADENGPDNPSSCDEGLSLCGELCVDQEVDPGHCGGCFNECTTGRSCSSGTCVLDCGVGLYACANSCVDLSSDSMNCGQCDLRCAEGHTCRSSVCVPTCPPDLTDCGGVCVDTTSDPNNCGHCDSRCPAGRVCADSYCVAECPSGLTNCNGACVNLSSDRYNCGQCGTRCPDAKTCRGGVCVDACPTGQVECNGVCVDTLTNRQHCGGCNSPCPAGHGCVTGACVPDCDPLDPSCDDEPPTVPTQVRALAESGSSILVTWAEATDNLGVAGYRVRRDGVEVASTESLSHLDSGLSPSTTYTYTVVAVDVGGNQSAPSSPVQESTFVGTRPDRPGHSWVRRYPFTVSALIHSDRHWSPTSYLAANFNASHVWAHGPHYPHGHNGLLESSEQHGLRWHLNIWADSLTQPVRDQIDRVCGSDCTQAYYVYDEPLEAQFAGIGQVVSHLKAHRPNSLIYMSTADFADSYVAGLMNHIDPDVLMYCMYPFYADGTNWGRYYRTLAQKRTQSLEYDIPFFTWIHAFAGAHGDVWRKPSRSEVRMHLYTTLTAGSKGISYFLWDIDDLANLFDYAITLPGGIPTKLHDEVQLINPRIERLGEVLKWLTSVDLRFVPGRNRDNFVPWQNSTPNEISRWSRGAGGISEITDVDVGAGQYHRRKNGLIGFFEDDGGMKYFMLTNFFCDEHMSPEQAAVEFTMTFDASVDHIYRFNQQTGEQDVVTLGPDRTLSLTFPGGTGDLFCLVPGCF